MRALSLALLAWTAAAAGSVADRRHPPGSPDAGLPLPSASWTPYDAAPDHVLNRIFRRAWLAELTPADVGAALPREADARTRLPEDWMLSWRDGVPEDARLFGGDGRQLPREGFAADEARALAHDLAALGPDEISALRAQPALAVLFQHDLLRVVQRLVATGRNTELVAPLLAAAQGVALPRSVLVELNDPLERASAPSEDLPVVREYRRRDSAYVEVLRRSTQLFDASRTLLWSRVHLAHPDGPEATRALIEAARGGAEVDVPVGTRALLVQGIVALDADGATVATPLVVDVRAQVLANRDERGRDNPTSTHDGVDFELLQLEREGLRRADERPVYRVVGEDDQDLFRDYGTLKHTTYRAQCALCHRTTRTPEPHLGGFPVLRPSARPAAAATGEERARLAEDEVRAWLERVRTR